jgi:hypothetical protein
VDIYNSTLGNDMEPTSLTQCAYRRPNDSPYCGQGYFYTNLLAASISLLAGNPSQSTLLTVASPVNHSTVALASALDVVYFFSGPAPTQVAVHCGQQLLATATASPIHVPSLAPCAPSADGVVQLLVVALGVDTIFALQADQPDLAQESVRFPPAVRLDLAVA